jgi:hypothetical protein
MDSVAQIVRGGGGREGVRAMVNDPSPEPLFVSRYKSKIAVVMESGSAYSAANSPHRHIQFSNGCLEMSRLQC